jgi:2-methylcitrate dehydratase PrpD
VIHPAAPVAPALFALSELRPVSGQELLHAVILGVETECRIGIAISPAHYRRGWHITSTCGVFGAAAATGRLLGLDRQRIVWAIGNAAAQSAGPIESLGNMAKSISVGNAARNGLAATLLAEQGFTGPEQAIEGTYGFARVTSDEADFSAITDALGDSWEILTNAYKPYPCGVVLFPVIDGCLELRERHALSADRIAALGAHNGLRSHPTAQIRANVSARLVKTLGRHRVRGQKPLAPFLRKPFYVTTRVAVVRALAQAFGKCEHRREKR